MVWVSSSEAGHVLERLPDRHMIDRHVLGHVLGLIFFLHKCLFCFLSLNFFTFFQKSMRHLVVRCS